MMFLQADVLQIGTATLSVATFGLVLRLSFGAGRVVEQVDGHERRITRLEDGACPLVERRAEAETE
jgi:hypothetical protein